MKNTLLLLIFGIGFLLSGCIKNNPDPSWIEIKAFEVLPNPNLTEGSLERNNFTHAWVYINEKFIGVFQVPCKLPVLVSGTANLRIYPTILNNGISETKLNYHYTAPHEETVELVKNETVTIHPKTKYMDGTTFFIEDFEGGNVKFNSGTGSNANLVVDNVDGERVGKVVVNSEANFWSAYLVNGADNEFFTFPPFGKQVFLEVEVNNEAPVTISVIYVKTDGSMAQQENNTVTTNRPGWKKLYFDMTEVVSNSGGYGFWFGFQANLPEGSSSATVLLDNIKLVY